MNVKEDLEYAEREERIKTLEKIREREWAALERSVTMDAERVNHEIIHSILENIDLLSEKIDLKEREQKEAGRKHREQYGPANRAEEYWMARDAASDPLA